MPDDFLVDDFQPDTGPIGGPAPGPPASNPTAPVVQAMQSQYTGGAWETLGRSLAGLPGALVRGVRHPIDSTVDLMRLPGELDKQVDLNPRAAFTGGVMMAIMPELMRRAGAAVGKVPETASNLASPGGRAGIVANLPVVGKLANAIRVGATNPEAIDSLTGQIRSQRAMPMNQVALAIKLAGGDPLNPNSITGEVAERAFTLLRGPRSAAPAATVTPPAPAKAAGAPVAPKPASALPPNVVGLDEAVGTLNDLIGRGRMTMADAKALVGQTYQDKSIVDTINARLRSTPPRRSK